MRKILREINKKVVCYEKMDKDYFLISLEIIIYTFVQELTNYCKTVTEGTLYEKIIYLLYYKNDNWWNRLPIDVEYKYINRDIDLIEVKTDEMTIHTLSDPPGVFRTENKIIAIEWRTENMEDMVYCADMNKSGIGENL